MISDFSQSLYVHPPVQAINPCPGSGVSFTSSINWQFVDRDRKRTATTLLMLVDPEITGIIIVQLLFRKYTRI